MSFISSIRNVFRRPDPKPDDAEPIAPIDSTAHVAPPIEALPEERPAYLPQGLDPVALSQGFRQPYVENPIAKAERLKLEAEWKARDEEIRRAQGILPPAPKEKFVPMWARKPQPMAPPPTAEQIALARARATQAPPIAQPVNSHLNQEHASADYDATKFAQAHEAQQRRYRS